MISDVHTIDFKRCIYLICNLINRLKKYLIFYTISRIDMNKPKKVGEIIETLETYSVNVKGPCIYVSLV